MIGTTGRLEAAGALTDEDRRDFEIDRQGQFDVAPAIQVTSASLPDR